MELQGYESYKMMKNFGLPIEPLTKVQKIGFNRVSSLITSHKYENVMQFTAAGTSIMHNKYQYDAVDNILGITNTVAPTRGNSNGDKKFGGVFKHSYAYDD
jgi:RHS repeat-associated core domain protein